MQIGIDSFAALVPDPITGHTVTAQERITQLLQEIELADKVGLDSGRRQAKLPKARFTAVLPFPEGAQLGSWGRKCKMPAGDLAVYLLCFCTAAVVPTLSGSPQ